MTDPLPADVREYLARLSDLDGLAGIFEGAREVLAKYPKPQPEPWPFPLPPKFHVHAEVLRIYAQDLTNGATSVDMPSGLRRIADEIDPGGNS